MFLFDENCFRSFRKYLPTYLFHVKFVHSYQIVSKWHVCNLIIFHLRSFPDTKMPSFSSVNDWFNWYQAKNIFKLKWYLSAVYCFDSPVNCKNEYMMECRLNERSSYKTIKSPEKTLMCLYHFLYNLLNDCLIIFHLL